MNCPPVRFLRFTASCTAFGRNNAAGDVFPLADLAAFRSDLEIVLGANLAEIIERFPAPELAAEPDADPEPAAGQKKKKAKK